MNRIKSMLPSLISKHHRAFVPGILIQDNVVIAHEAYHYLENKKLGNRAEFSLKIDMKKA